jgi:IclR family pca regulon transcriptional regulator
MNVLASPVAAALTEEPGLLGGEAFQTLAGAERDDGFVQSLARGLAVIEAFGRGRERLTIAQTALACGLTRAGARRILLTLNQLGYVAFDGRYFRLTARTLELGAGHRRRSLWETAQPMLEELATALNVSASAGQLDGWDVVYTVRARPPKILHAALSPGAHLPAFATSLGRVLLAALPQPELETYFAAVDLAPLTPLTVRDCDTLRERIAEARERGWCCTRGEVDERYACVAVPLLDRDGGTLAALSVGMGLNDADPSLIEGDVVPRLQSVARAIALAL